MTARDTTTNTPHPRDPRATGTPHYFVRRTSGGLATCAVCGQVRDAPIHTVKRYAA